MKRWKSLKKNNKSNALALSKFQTIVLLIGGYYFFYLNSATCQEIIKMTSQGEYIATNLTPELATSKAVEDAKKNALIKAGVTEIVNVSSLLYTYQKDIGSEIEFQQIFSELSTIESRGEVLADSVRVLFQDWQGNNSLYVKVEILATVFKYKSHSDPSFDFKVLGINDSYTEGSALKFTFLPYSNGFIKVFSISNDTCCLLYPYHDNEFTWVRDDPNREFIAYQDITFPILTALGEGYSLKKNQESENSEINYLLFIFTKSNIPFKNDLSLDGILRWVYSIPPELRRVQYYTVLII